MALTTRLLAGGEGWSVHDVVCTSGPRDQDHSYVEEHRAAARLCRSRERVATVALQSGFEDLSTFNRQFRRIFGLTPGEYRAKAGAESVPRRARVPVEGRRGTL